MKTIIISISLIVIFLPSIASSKVLTIGLDMSSSSPIFDHNFSNAAAKSVAKKIKGMKKGDYIIIRRFGETGLSNIIKDDDKKQITKRFKQKKAAEHFSKMISSLPDKKDSIQSSTNIIAWLEQTDFYCKNSGEIWLITDAIEASVYISEADLLEGKKPLPSPKKDYLKLCSVSIFGLGLSNLNLSPIHINTLKSKWEQWMKEAGINHFQIIKNP